MPDRLTRRSLLAGSVGATAGLLSVGQDTAGAHPAPKAGHGATRFFADPTLNFQTLFALGSVGYGISETGEVLSAIDRINARGASYQRFFEEFLRLGASLARRAATAADHGRRVTARECYLRSAEYYAQALYFVLGTNRPTRVQERAVYRLMQTSWDRATQLFTPRFERLRIPYGGAVPLRGYLLKPDDRSRPRPTIILNNGSDAQNIDLYAFGGAAAVARGYNALIFEGPGQGSLLFEHDVPIIPDWEHVVTPVVDALRRRDDVDRHRIAIAGWSFCGSSVARAAAFEHRLAAVVLDPGVDSITAPWTLGRLLALVQAGRKREVDRVWREVLRHQTPEGRFTIAKRSEIFGQPDFYEQVRYMLQFNLDAAMLARVTAPTLVMQAQDEQFYPGQSERVYQALRSPKRLLRFTTAEGAEFHDEPMAPQTRNEGLYDWLDETLGI
jgi:hypothetical protein